MNLVLLAAEEVDKALRGEDGLCIKLPREDRRAKHITGVLKPAPGASIRVGVIGRGVGAARVTLLEDGGVRLAAGSQDCPELELTPEPEAPHIELMLAMPRPKVMMRLYSSLAQIGLRRIVLTNAVRVEKPYFSSHAVERSKYLPELQDGLEQAVSTRLPEVRVEQRLKPFVEDQLDGLFPEGLLRLLCHPGEGASSVAEAVRRAPTPPRGILLAVGPEGGWVDFELEMLERKGFQRVSLGTRIFSTDVAVLALTSLAADALAEIGAVPLPQEGA